MEPNQLSRVANYIRGVAYGALSDLRIHGRHHDVILPTRVLRRLGAASRLPNGATLNNFFGEIIRGTSR